MELKKKLHQAINKTNNNNNNIYISQSEINIFK